MSIKPGPNDVVRGEADIAALKAIRKAQPTKADLLSLPGAKCKEWVDERGVTQWKVRVPLNKGGNRANVLDMTKKATEMEVGRCRTLSAEQHRETVRDRNGRLRSVDARFLNEQSRKVLTPKWNIGRGRDDVRSGYLTSFDPHERWWTAFVHADGSCEWVARLGGRHGDIVAEGRCDDLDEAQVRAECALRELDLPDEGPKFHAPAVFVH